MKLMTAMPIEIRQDLVADGAFASDSHCKIIGFPIGMHSCYVNTIHIIEVYKKIEVTTQKNGRI